ncbi:MULTISPECIES: hypothetical protein [unclassified Nitrobacter]|uniref:hypothetical protein n=1 Tax=unclassified Nitrobacter TaxID=2620411 RepID=UPI0009272966|nr:MULTISPECIES: hypothetical protein [unclassified Nitrobacter]MBN9147172.1 hypothetical protein [Nitrobacter sp.]OJV02330.1 MAG: hypothetical protein BGO16_01910 [Nitrobacter sp. 62-23]
MPTLLSIEALKADRRYVERQLAEVGDNPWATARHMWQTRLAEIDAQIAALSASSSNYASVALIFDGNPVIGSGDIRLDFTTDALDSYQKIISLALAARLSQDDLPERGRLPGADKSRLFIRDLVRGSMGFVLEEIAPELHEMLPTPLKDTVESVTQLLTTLTDATDDVFESTLESTQPRVVGAVQKFAKVLHEAGASTKIVGDQERLTLSLADVGRLSQRLNEVEVTEEAETVDGILLGILPESHEFELKPPGDDAVTIKGSISDDLALKYTADAAFKERLLLQPVQAQIKVIRTTRNGKLMRERRVLEALEPAQA